VRHETGASFLLEAPEGIPAYVDGEFVAHDLRRVEARIAPGALALF
jgi:anti-sigma factor RsiW